MNLEDIFLERVPVLRSYPHFMRGRLRQSFDLALRERHRAHLAGDRVASMGSGSVGRDELCSRADQFAAGEWVSLIDTARSVAFEGSAKGKAISEEERRGKAAQYRVLRGPVSRARHETGAALPPRTDATFAELQGRRPQAPVRPIPREVLDFVPDQVLDLDQQEFVKCLRTSPSKSAPGPGGCTNELLRVCLDDCELLQLLFLAAEDLARGNAPPAAKPFMTATMTALSKKDGGVLGIATGTSFRRLVAKTLARQFMKEVERTCAPFQFALSTRAGVDCVGHAVRAATDADPRATVLSIDGIGAYDHVLRAP